jgi:hypothetical protein
MEKECKDGRENVKLSMSIENLTLSLHNKNLSRKLNVSLSVFIFGCDN